MSEKPEKKPRIRKKPEEIVSILASKYDVSVRWVQMVISGEKKSENILVDYITYKQSHNSLLKAVRELVPF